MITLDKNKLREILLRCYYKINKGIRISGYERIVLELNEEGKLFKKSNY